jgi:hypothetical protein
VSERIAFVLVKQFENCFGQAAYGTTAFFVFVLRHADSVVARVLSHKMGNLASKIGAILFRFLPPDGKGLDC